MRGSTGDVTTGGGRTPASRRPSLRPGSGAGPPRRGDCASLQLEGALEPVQDRGYYGVVGRGGIEPSQPLQEHHAGSLVDLRPAQDAAPRRRHVDGREAIAIGAAQDVRGVDEGVPIDRGSTSPTAFAPLVRTPIGIGRRPEEERSGQDDHREHPCGGAPDHHRRPAGARQLRRLIRGREPIGLGADLGVVHRVSLSSTCGSWRSVEIVGHGAPA